MCAHWWRRTVEIEEQHHGGRDKVECRAQLKREHDYTRAWRECREGRQRQGRRGVSFSFCFSFLQEVPRRRAGVPHEALAGAACSRCTGSIKEHTRSTSGSPGRSASSTQDHGGRVFEMIGGR